MDHLIKSRLFFRLAHLIKDRIDIIVLDVKRKDRRIRFDILDMSITLPDSLLYSNDEIAVTVSIIFLSCDFRQEPVKSYFFTPSIQNL